MNIRIIKEEPNWKDLEQLTPKQHEQTMIDYLHYLMYKITIQYKNKDLQKKLLLHVEELKSNIAKIIEECNKYITQCINIYNQIISTSNKLNKQSRFLKDYNYNLPHSILYRMNAYISSIWSDLNDGIIGIFTGFMDIYFLRRFLDKDYITNVIAYTGAYHTNVYIFTLVKEFGFKVTHYSYSKITNIDNLNKEIIKTDFFDDISEFLYPPIFTQCSDMSHFPKNFN